MFLCAQFLQIPRSKEGQASRYQKVEGGGNGSSESCFFVFTNPPQSVTRNKEEATAFLPPPSKRAKCDYINILFQYLI